jgi:hypothetical protein
MDGLVLRKIIALRWTLESMYWQERLQEVIKQLDREIIAEHGAQRINGIVHQVGVYSPETCLIISACS